MPTPGGNSQDVISRFGTGWNRFWFQAADPLTCGVLRCLVGALATYWLASFTPDLVQLFGTGGLINSQGLSEWRGNMGFSLLDYVSSNSTLWLVHGVALVAAVALTVGCLSRVSSAITAILVLSYIWRAPMLAGSAEDLLAMLLVYLSLAPSGAAFSLDAWWAARRNAAENHLDPTGASAPRRSSMAQLVLRLIQVHIAIIYLAMVLAKLRSAAWWQGDAVWWISVRPEHPLLDWSGLAGATDLVAAMTHAMVLIEFAFPILVWNRLARPLMLSLAALVWVLLILLTGHVLFGLLMLCGLLAFVPGETLRARLERFTRRPAANSTTAATAAPAQRAVPA